MGSVILFIGFGQEIAPFTSAIIRPLKVTLMFILEAKSKQLEQREQKANTDMKSQTRERLSKAGLRLLSRRSKGR